MSQDGMAQQWQPASGHITGEHYITAKRRAYKQKQRQKKFKADRQAERNPEGTDPGPSAAAAASGAAGQEAVPHTGATDPGPSNLVPASGTPYLSADGTFHSNGIKLTKRQRQRMKLKFQREAAHAAAAAATAVPAARPNVGQQAESMNPKVTDAASPPEHKAHEVQRNVV